MTALKRLAGVVALTTIVPLAILLVLEGFANMGILAHRILTVQPPPRLQHTAPDSLLGWSGQPNVALPNAYGPGLSLTHDASGMRIHRPVPDSVAPGQRRILCSGGSLLHGAGVADSQTTCAYLERDLPGVNTLDLAQEGFGIDQAYLAYRRDGGRYPHRLQLFAFTRGDFDRLARSWDRGYAKPVLALHDGRLLPDGVPLPATPTSGRWSAMTSVLSESRLAQAIERRTGVTESRRRREAARSWQIAQAVFRSLDSLNRARGSRLVLAYLPTLGDLREGAGDDRRAALAAFSERAGIPFVDLTAGMRAVSPDTADWFFITPNALPVRGLAGHYSTAGNRWVAALLAERLAALPELADAMGGRSGVR
jgi:hypothetical protein